MPRRYEPRHVSQSTGALVASVALVIVALVVFSARVPRWFERELTVKVDLPEEGSYGLREGSEVHMLGTVVGEVDGIRLTPAGAMQATIQVRGDFVRYVCNDTDATIRRRLLGGDAFLVLCRGSGPVLKDGETIRGTVDKELSELASEAIEQLRKEILPAFHEYGELARELRSPEGKLQRTLDQVDRLTHALDQGEGALGRLLKDQEMAKRVENIVVHADASLDVLPDLIAEAREAVAGLNQVSAAVGKQLESIPGLVEQTQSTMAGAGDLVSSLDGTAKKVDGIATAIDREMSQLPGMVQATQAALKDGREILGHTREATADLSAITKTFRKEAEALPDAVAGGKKAAGEAYALIKELRETVMKTSAILGTVREQAQLLPDLVRQTQKTLEGVGDVLGDVRETTREMPGILQTAGAEVKALPDLVRQTQSAIEEIERLVRGMQRHWLVRKYVDKADESGGRISPAESGLGELGP